MVRPEGYRKAIRLMELANNFNLPVLSFVDTAGAYPGRGAEERGQAEAIARSIQACLNLKTPLISAIVGEGGSGGAIALATGNRVVMFEHAVYSVISPEGCASILWRSSEKAQIAAEALRLTAQDMKQLGVIDAIVDEPLGGAHRQIEQALDSLSAELLRQLDELQGLSPAELRADRRKKYVTIGDILENIFCNIGNFRINRCTGKKILTKDLITFILFLLERRLTIGRKVLLVILVSLLISKV